MSIQNQEESKKKKNSIKNNSKFEIQEKQSFSY